MQAEINKQEAAIELAIESNHSFWQLAETDVNDQQKRELLSSALASVYLWTQAGNDENKYLSYMAAARAFAINDAGPLAKDYASKAYAYFSKSEQAWAKAFSAAILSHALQLVGKEDLAATYYQESIDLSARLSEQERQIFASTFDRIPRPANAA